MIDASLIKHLSDDEKHRLQILERFFEHEGWKLLVGYLESQYNLAQDQINNAQNWDAYLMSRTKMKLCHELGQLPEATRQEFETMALEHQASTESEDFEEELNYE